MTEQVNTVTGEIVPLEPAATITLFRTDDPAKVVTRAAEIATSLAGVLEKQHLYVNIQGRKHVRVEGWTLLGSMLGVFPVCVWTKPVEGGWEARVEARTLSGAIVGAAEAQCLAEERNWGDRDDYALRSMAQTRATSKALRLPLGFVISMAGFDATPAEEVPAGGFVQSGDRKAPLGVCPTHKMPFLQNEKQRAAGYPPSHPIKGTSPTQWCERKVNLSEPEELDAERDSLPFSAPKPEA